MQKLTFIILFSALVLFGMGSVYFNQGDAQPKAATGSDGSKVIPIADLKTAIFAGGCFWCVESDFEKLKGVSEAVSGYTGGAAETANYKQVSYTETGHYEAVEVYYDPTIVSYAELVEYFWRTIDPTDPNGQFCDKGSSYKTAIFYSSDEEKAVLDKSLEELNKSKPFDEPIVTAIEAAKPFYVAEDNHQNYYSRNPLRYKYYRNGCRRDQRLEQLWQK